MIIRLIKPGKSATITYEGDLLARDQSWVAVRATWSRGTVDLGLLRFAPGDVLIEHFYTDRWYNIFQLHAADGALKGWYCNVTRPAVIAEDYVESEDLELDLLVSADRAQTRLDDEDEFLARDFDPETVALARRAVAELQAMVGRGEKPFSVEC